MTTSETPRHCAIEGNSGAGKSSTARLLAQTWGQPGFVGEYFDYFRPLGLNMPELPPPDPLVGRAQSAAWAIVDRRRYADLRGLTRGSYPAVLDTTVLSVLACEMAKQELGEASAVAEVTAEYRRLLDYGTVRPPEFWVFLETSYCELERRIAKRCGSRAFLRRPEVAAYLQAFRASFAERYLADGEFLWLCNDTSPVEDVVAAITEYAHNRHARSAGAGLRRFLDNLTRHAGTL